MEIPDWGDTKKAVEGGNPTPLETFIYNNEPAGILDCRQFLEQLKDALDYVRGLTGETAMVNTAEYERLKKRSEWLECLEAAGVDNWSGYSHARKIQDKWYSEETKTP